ncbi:MAG: DUF5702 domain-containing protein [Lachnospiraceae bacterium]|nr:DUF5702 domain-containing protein [Lachnospiraceae bacterium]
MKGYLTAFTAMILAVLMPLWLLLIQGSQISGMKAKAEMVMDIGMNSVLAEYHREMLRDYDLFLLDTSYCSDLPTRAKTAEHLQSYLKKNLEPVDDLFSFLGLGFLGTKEAETMSASEVSVDMMRYATDGHASVLRSQILSYELDLLGLSGLEDTIGQQVADEWNNSGAEGLLENHHREDWNQAQQELQPYRYVNVPEEEGGGRKVALENPADYLFSLSGAALSGIILGNPENLSAAEQPIRELYSGRLSEKDPDVIYGDMPVPESNVKLAAKLFFLDYLLHHFHSYQMKEGSVPEHETRFACELEYILCGNASDKANLEETVGRMLMIRQAVNTAYLFTDANKQQQLEAAAKALAVAASAVTMSPVPSAPIKVSLTMAWGLLESIQDMKILCNGGKIALLKGNGVWRTDLGNLAHPGEGSGGDAGDEKGLTYEQYLCLLLLMQNDEEQMNHCIDVMELNIRMNKGNENFRMDACADRLLARARIGRGDTWFYIGREYGYEE